MIKVDTLEVHDFRGIKSLTLQLNCGNFAICGQNGTGKSGVVDALEFALTGNIARLSGRGTGDIGLKAHGPHVDSRKHPENARVVLSGRIPSLGNRSFTIERCVKSPSKASITPNDAQVLAILDEVAAHPEFALSRREIIRFILTEPGTRSRQVSALLKLDKLESTRGTLLKIRNAEDRVLRIATAARHDAASKLKTALGANEPNASGILAAVNKLRDALALPPIESLTADTDLRAGLHSSSGSTVPTVVAKAVAQGDIVAAKELIAQPSLDPFLGQIYAALAKLDEFEANAVQMHAAEKEHLLNAAMKQFDGTKCPVCETPWHESEFKALVESRLKSLEEFSLERATLQKLVRPVAQYCDELSSSCRVLGGYASKLKLPGTAQSFDDASAAWRVRAERLRDLFPLENSRQCLDEISSEGAGLDPLISDLSAKIAELPEPSKQDEARESLIVIHERFKAYGEAQRKLKTSAGKLATATDVYDTFVEVAEAELAATYAAVEARFSELYRAVNSDDEGEFTAKLTRAAGSLDLQVDFYGRGHFPPAAFHSEGHQDSMGICLYLALMEKLQGSHFHFAVLDDVLMSVDKGHRREISKLLRDEFSQTQFVLTTHDDVWLRHMRTEGLVKSKAVAHFRRWTVDAGPCSWDSDDVWDEIRCLLDDDKVPHAAAVLRRYLEHFAHDACSRLRALVEFKGDGQFTLGDLLPRASATLRDTFKRGKISAQSWSKDTSEINSQDDRLGTAVAKSHVDQWQINSAVHYNAWAALSPEDFTPVVQAFRNLVALFYCETCGVMLYVSPDYGSPELLRCACQATSVNLVTKKGPASLPAAE